MTVMESNLDELRMYWNSFNAKNPEFKRTDKTANLLFLSNVEIDKNWVVLDIGCGPGRLAEMCHNKVKEYYGVDVAKNMIKEAEETKKYPNVKFSVNDGCTLKEFENEKFDVVVMATVTQHISKGLIKSYIDEIHRVLKPNGFFLINFPKHSFYEFYGFNKPELFSLLSKFKCEEFYDDPKNAQFFIKGIKK